MAAARTLSGYPVRTILTSGGPGPIGEHVDVLRRMREAAGHVRIMAGGGLTLANAPGLLQAPGCRQPGNASAHHHDIKRFHARSCLLLWGTSYGSTTNTTKAGMVKFTNQIRQPNRPLSPTACRP